MAPSTALTEAPSGHERPHFYRIARAIRLASLPIILIWIAVAAFLNISVPQLEEVGKQRSVSMSPDEAPAVISMQRIGEVFEEYESNSSVMIVLEGDQPLGDDTRAYYADLIDRLEADTRHVEHIQDLWSDPLTASGAQSADGRATYFQVYLAGNQGRRWPTSRWPPCRTSSPRVSHPTVSPPTSPVRPHWPPNRRTRATRACARSRR